MAVLYHETEMLSPSKRSMDRKKVAPFFKLWLTSDCLQKQIWQDFQEFDSHGYVVQPNLCVSSLYTEA